MFSLFPTDVRIGSVLSLPSGKTVQSWRSIPPYVRLCDLGIRGARKSYSTSKESNVVEGTHQWEAKVAAVHNQYGEKPTDNMMAAIFLGMLPGEYQRMAMRCQTLGKQKGIPKYEELRDYVLSVCQQEAINVSKSANSVDNQEQANEEWPLAGAGWDGYEWGGYLDMGPIMKGKGKGGKAKGRERVDVTTAGSWDTLHGSARSRRRVRVKGSLRGSQSWRRDGYRGEKAKGQVCLIMVYTTTVRDQKGRGSRVTVSAAGG